MGGHSGAMTLTQALVKSINVIPVKLSIMLGNGNPKIALLLEVGLLGGGDSNVLHIHMNCGMEKQRNGLE